MVIDNSKGSKKGPDVGLIYVNDFGDGYHKLNNDPSNDLERAVRKIRRRYRAFDDYKRALGIYFEYMDTLANKYGGHKHFQIRMESNTVFEYIPPLPKLKKNPINDFITEHKILISDPNRVTYDNEALEKYETQFEDELTEDTRMGNEIIKNKNDKLLEKMVKKGIYGKIDAKRMKEVDAVDILASYFDSSTSKKGKDGKKKDKKYEMPSITDIIEDRVVDEEEQEAIFYRGRLMTPEELAQMKLYQELNNYGWNSLALMKQADRGSSSALASVLRDEEFKKKRAKKNKKKGKGSKAANEFLVKMMGDNDESFEDFEESMLDFTINSIFK